MTPFYRKKQNHPHTRLWKIPMVVGFCSLLALVLYNTHDIFFGAPLSLEPLSNGAHFSQSYVPISGRTRNPQQLTINGRNVVLTKEGYFEDAVILSEGYNTIVVRLVDRFGKIKERTYHVVLQTQNEELARK